MVDPPLATLEQQDRLRPLLDANAFPDEIADAMVATTAILIRSAAVRADALLDSLGTANQAAIDSAFAAAAHTHPLHTAPTIASLPSPNPAAIRRAMAYDDDDIAPAAAAATRELAWAADSLYRHVVRRAALMRADGAGGVLEQRYAQLIRPMDAEGRDMSAAEPAPTTTTPTTPLQGHDHTPASAQPLQSANSDGSVRGDSDGDGDGGGSGGGVDGCGDDPPPNGGSANAAAATAAAYAARYAGAPLAAMATASARNALVCDDAPAVPAVSPRVWGTAAGTAAAAATAPGAAEAAAGAPGGAGTDGAAGADALTRTSLSNDAFAFTDPPPFRDSECITDEASTMNTDGGNGRAALLTAIRAMPVPRTDPVSDDAALAALAAGVPPHVADMTIHDFVAPHGAAARTSVAALLAAAEAVHSAANAGRSVVRGLLLAHPPPHRALHYAVHPLGHIRVAERWRFFAQRVARAAATGAPLAVAIAEAAHAPLGQSAATLATSRRVMRLVWNRMARALPPGAFAGVYAKVRAAICGGAVRPAGALVAHSCVPNAFWSSQSVLRAAVPLPRGALVTVDYGCRRGAAAVWRERACELAMTCDCLRDRSDVPDDDDAPARTAAPATERPAGGPKTFVGARRAPLFVGPTADVHELAALAALVDAGDARAVRKYGGARHSHVSGLSGPADLKSTPPPPPPQRQGTLTNTRPQKTATDDGARRSAYGRGSWRRDGDRAAEGRPVRTRGGANSDRTRAGNPSPPSDADSWASMKMAVPI